ncbi:MAG: hypothetical protein HY737_02315 [Candidatus Omnitrophica bacterium]|nr:hypothetical protein [Candidatus Omnitrophota bacterium]
MPDQLESLKKLQAIDAQLYQLKRQQVEKPKELERVAAAVAAEEAKLAAATERMKSLQLAQKEKELDLQTREANVKKLQGQLFQLKTNKEYAAMQREIDAHKADNSVLEEDIIKLFDAIEQATKERQTEHARVVQEQARLAKERQRIEEDLAIIADSIGKLERQREAALPDVPKAALDVYERVLVLRHGLALVSLVNDACGGCHRRMPPQVVNEVYLKAKLVTCESCNRILFFDEAHSKL